MICTFYGGPYDGIRLKLEDVETYAMLIPTRTRTVLMPDLSQWGQLWTGSLVIPDWKSGCLYRRVDFEHHVDFLWFDLPPSIEHLEINLPHQLN